MTQKTPAQLRELAVSRLTEPGRRRLRLLIQLEEIDTELRPLIQEARDVEVSLRKIQELTGVAPNTIRAWTKDG